MEDYDQLVEYLEYSTELSLDSIDTSDVAQLYKEKKYYQVLSLVSATEIIPSVRLILALTLFKLGRFQAALRELAIAIELEVDPMERIKLIKYEIKIFTLLDLDKTKPCLEELNTISSQEVINIEDIKLEDACVLPIHLQAKEYEKYGKLNELSIGKISIVVDNLIEESLHSFDDKLGDPLTPLFKAINLFGPSYLYAPILGNTNKYMQYIEAKFQKFPEIDLSIELKPLTKMLSKIGHNSNNFLTDLIIKLRYIAAYLELLKGNYYEASYHYLWVLNFIEILKRKLPKFWNKTEYFSVSTQRNCVILLTQCIEFGKIDYSVSTLENLVVKSSDYITNVTAEFFYNRLWKMFYSYGILYEKIARKNCTRFCISNSVLTRYEPLALETMVSQYILAMTYKPQDDPSILQLMNRIIWGLMMHGGIHLETIWYFLKLKNYYQVHIDLGPIQCDEKIFYKEYNYSNLNEIISRLQDLPKQIIDSNPWSLSNGDTYLVPVIFECGEKLLLMEKYLDESSLYYDNSNFIVHENGVLTKLKSHCKISHKRLQETHEKSKKMIELFTNNYTQYHGPLPDSLVYH